MVLCAKPLHFQPKCRDCGASVYFSCSCDSKVFFDELGEPWIEQDCERRWARGLKRRKSMGGGVQVELSPGVTATRPPDVANGWRIDPSVLVAARQNERLRTRNPIESVPGAEWSVHVTGVVRELDRDVDVYGALGLPRTKWARDSSAIWVREHGTASQCMSLSR